MQREPTVADVVAARRVVARYLPRAPLERSPLERASYEYLEALSLLVEPSGAAPLAAVPAGKVDLRGRRTVLVVSDGNAAPALIARIAAQRDAEAIRV